MRKKINYYSIFRKKALFFSFLILILFIGLGYSIFNIHLNIFGNINVQKMKNAEDGLVITKAKQLNATDLEIVHIKKIDHNSFNFDVTLANSPTSSAVVEITIKNYTDQEYIFDDIFYNKTSSDLYSNLNIVPTISNITPNGTKIGSNEEITLQITFTYLDNSMIDDSQLTGTIQFDFTPTVLIHFNGLTSASGNSEESIRTKPYTNMEGTVFSPFVDLGEYRGNISIKNQQEDITLNKETDYNYQDGVVTFLNELTEEYTIFAEQETSIEHITNIIDGIEPDTNGIYTGTPGDGCTNTLAYDETSDNNLRYIGSNPCNYVYFNCDDSGNNCELWRMIGIMNDVGEEPSIKIVKSSLDYSGTPFNTSSNNTWIGSTLYTTLNTTYYESFNQKYGKDLILDTNWNLGGIENTWTCANFYLKEHAEKSTESFKVGLFSPSDYGYATSGGNTARRTCISSQLNGTGYTNNCRTNNWLYTNSSYQWTMTRRPSSANNQVYYVTTAGLTAYATVTSSSDYYNYRPCVYLKPTVKIVDGDGSQNTPYKVS